MTIIVRRLIIHSCGKVTVKPPTIKAVKKQLLPGEMKFDIGVSRSRLPLEINSKGTIVGSKLDKTSR